VALIGLHHVHLRVNDLEKSRSFAKDFGLHEVAVATDRQVYLRGAGTGAYQVVLEPADKSSLAGIAFAVDSREDLDWAVAEHAASPVRSLESPGGGEAVTLTDPEGTSVHLVHGVAGRTQDPLPPQVIINQGLERIRRGAAQYQPPLAPPQLLRLGHVGLFVRDFKTCEAWYRKVLGLLPSDVMYADNPENVVAGFYRLDRGNEWVDHHTIALFGFGKNDLHHISFEVQNPDTQFIAHRWLERQGHKLVWGVGRHPKGSHVFDVWRDPSGYRFETYSDTDVCMADNPAGTFDITTMEMDVWSNRSYEAYFE
jgi:catechol 2,3-dioxygenase-like lactoylglutathione lyase family enzyme